MKTPADKILGKAQCRLSGVRIGRRCLASLCLIFGLCLLAWPRLAYSFAIGAIGSIDLKGNNVSSDSFDSSDPLYSTNGLYTPSKRKAGGDILTISDLTSSILNVGNANIAGHIQIGPDGHWNILNGSVGDLAWVDSGTIGIQPGWALTNRSYYFPPVVLPQTTWLTPGGPGVVDGKSYAHVFSVSGDYWLTDAGDIYVDTNVTVRLNVTATNFILNNVFVAGTGTNAGRLVAYMNGPMGQYLRLGTGIKTQSGKAANLVFLGLPHCTEVLYMGNGDFTGVIYAPSAAFNGAGGGSGYIDFVGSVFARTFQLNGHYHFHFDEDLYRMTSPFPFLFAGQMPYRTAIVGQSTTFDLSGVPVIGAGPFTYQWQFQGPSIIGVTNSLEVTTIPGATNTSLTLTNLQVLDSGLYFARITNPAGFADSGAFLAVYSPVATLTAKPLSTNGVFQFFIRGAPAPGYSYVIESSTNLMDWSPIATWVSWVWFTDTNAAAFPQRFYRAVFVP
jgi:hypothetical protein